MRLGLNFDVWGVLPFGPGVFRAIVSPSSWTCPHSKFCRVFYWRAESGREPVRVNVLFQLAHLVKCFALCWPVSVTLLQDASEEVASHIGPSSQAVQVHGTSEQIHEVILQSGVSVRTAPFQHGEWCSRRPRQFACPSRPKLLSVRRKI